jgi:HPt (histidine-containing phosphotransfer) domain-containing protein
MIPDENKETLYDLTSLRLISRGNTAFVELMVNTFCDQTPPTVREMKETFNSGDLAKMSALAHKIKPSIDNLYITSLKQIIRNIEGYDAKKPGSINIVESLHQLDEIITRVVKMMRLEFPGHY